MDNPDAGREGKLHELGLRIPCPACGSTRIDLDLTPEQRLGDEFAAQAVAAGHFVCGTPNLNRIREPGRIKCQACGHQYQVWRGKILDAEPNASGRQSILDWLARRKPRQDS